VIPKSQQLFLKI